MRLTLLVIFVNVIVQIFTATTQEFVDPVGSNWRKLKRVQKLVQIDFPFKLCNADSMS